MKHSQYLGSIALTGQWDVIDDHGDNAMTMSLPGDVVSALYANKAIADPYWGRNEYDLRWISERDWILRRDIELDRTDLVFVAAEVDTVATITLNGQDGNFSTNRKHSCSSLACIVSRPPYYPLSYPLLS